MKDLIEKYVGKKFLYRGYCPSMAFEVIAFDVKKAWGRIDVAIKPVTGLGNKWVSAEALQPVINTIVKSEI